MRLIRTIYYLRARGYGESVWDMTPFQTWFAAWNEREEEVDAQVRAAQAGNAAQQDEKGWKLWLTRLGV